MFIPLSQTGSSSWPPTATDGFTHSTGAESRLLVLSELNKLLLWRGYHGTYPLTHGENVMTPSGCKTRIFIRPGAQELIALLLWEPRCELAFVSTMREKYCMPIAGRLLPCAFLDVEWTLE